MTPTPENLPLRDIHLPDPVNWWPPAPGWWGLLFLFLLLALAIRLLLILKRRNRLKKHSLTMLQQLSDQFRQNGDQQQLVVHLSMLLRRVALSVYPRRQVAALTGTDWLRFLDKGLNSDSDAKAFSEGIGRALIEAPYNPQCNMDAKALIGLIRQWITINAGHRQE